MEDEEVYESGRTGLVKDRLQHEPSKEEQEEIEVLSPSVASCAICDERYHCRFSKKMWRSELENSIRWITKIW